MSILPEIDAESMQKLRANVDLKILFKIVVIHELNAPYSNYKNRQRI